MMKNTIRIQVTKTEKKYTHLSNFKIKNFETSRISDMLTYVFCTRLRSNMIKYPLLWLRVNNSPSSQGRSLQYAEWYVTTHFVWESWYAFLHKILIYRVRVLVARHLFLSILTTIIALLVKVLLCDTTLITQFSSFYLMCTNQ